MRGLVDQPNSTNQQVMQARQSGIKPVITSVMWNACAGAEPTKLCQARSAHLDGAIHHRKGLNIVVYVANDVNKQDFLSE
eukprot:877691-Amphidinium_carterae.1